MISGNQLQHVFARMQHTTMAGDDPGIAVPNAADILRFVREKADGIDALCLQPVVRFAEHIPALSGNILELHFGKQSIDFATRLNIDFDKPMINAIKCKRSKLPFIGEDFTTLFRQEENGFLFGIENSWIEYDSPFHSAPALFFDISRKDVFQPLSVFNKLQQIAGIFQWKIDTELLHFLKQVKQAGLHTVYYGFMFSRVAKSVRLTINGLQAAQLAATLKTLGWKGNYQSVKKLAANYLQPGQKIVVGVDFENGVEDRIGIEVFDNAPAVFAGTLYKDGYISQKYFDFINTWQQRHKLPEQLGSALTRLHQRPVEWVYTRINHFKFVVDSSNEIGVKGYLYYCF